jgi:hypothetical protein
MIVELEEPYQQKAGARLPVWVHVVSPSSQPIWVTKMEEKGLEYNRRFLNGSKPPLQALPVQTATDDKEVKPYMSQCQFWFFRIKPAGAVMEHFLWYLPIFLPLAEAVVALPRKNLQACLSF